MGQVFVAEETKLTSKTAIVLAYWKCHRNRST